MKKSMSISDIIDLFQQGKTGMDKTKRYFALSNALVYRDVITEHGNLSPVEETLAIRTKDGVIIGNSSILTYTERKVAFGRTMSRWGRAAETEVQRQLAQRFVMLPFSVFKQASLNLFNLKVLEDSGSEKVTIERSKQVKKGYAYKTVKYLDEDVHFTGAKLFSLLDRVKNTNVIYLFDIDRNEIKHHIMNPFLVKLTDSSVKTIAEAYESLKPDTVKQAERAKIEVLRQGEWFFIKTGHEIEDFNPVKETNSWTNNEFQELRLSAGPNRPNFVSKHVDLGKGGHLVSGVVRHSGREHKDLELNGWFIPIANTAQESVTITGEID